MIKLMVKKTRASCLAGSAFFVLSLLVSGPASAGEVVSFDEPGIASGTIVVRTLERRLYYVLPEGHAVRYSVGVGRTGQQWAGQAVITGKYLRPNWAPPDSMRKNRPNLPDFIPSGSPANPMGAAAMTLSGGDYAIHGTNAPDSIGGFVSSGCIRMYNADISDLFARVDVGTSVLVTR